MLQINLISGYQLTIQLNQASGFQTLMKKLQILWKSSKRKQNQSLSPTSIRETLEIRVWFWCNITVYCFSTAGIYLFKVNNRSTWRGCEIIQSYQWRHQNDANGIVLVSFLLTLNNFTPCSSVSIVNFEHVIAGLEYFLGQYAERRSVFRIQSCM